MQGWRSLDNAPSKSTIKLCRANIWATLVGSNPTPCTYSPSEQLYSVASGSGIERLGWNAPPLYSRLETCVGRVRPYTES